MCNNDICIDDIQDRLDEIKLLYKQYDEFIINASILNDLLNWINKHNITELDNVKNILKFDDYLENLPNFNLLELMNILINFSQFNFTFETNIKVLDKILPLTSSIDKYNGIINKMIDYDKIFGDNNIENILVGLIVLCVFNNFSSNLKLLFNCVYDLKICKYVNSSVFVNIFNSCNFNKFKNMNFQTYSNWTKYVELESLFEFVKIKSMGKINVNLDYLIGLAVKNNCLECLNVLFFTELLKCSIDIESSFINHSIICDNSNCIKLFINDDMFEFNFLHSRGIYKIIVNQSIKCLSLLINLMLKKNLNVLINNFYYDLILHSIFSNKIIVLEWICQNIPNSNEIIYENFEKIYNHVLSKDLIEIIKIFDAQNIQKNSYISNSNFKFVLESSINFNAEKCFEYFIEKLPNNLLLDTKLCKLCIDNNFIFGLNLIHKKKIIFGQELLNYAIAKNMFECFCYICNLGYNYIINPINFNLTINTLKKLIFANGQTKLNTKLINFIQCVNKNNYKINFTKIYTDLIIYDKFNKELIDLLIQHNFIIEPKQFEIIIFNYVEDCIGINEFIEFIKFIKFIGSDKSVEFNKFDKFDKINPIKQKFINSLIELVDHLKISIGLIDSINLSGIIL